MSARRGATELSGILAIDKPAGMTSHDVVNRVRRATGERRVGHAGTLDPMATGLLVVLVGPATRLASYLTAAEKTYLATVVFGAETDTDDAEGEVTVTAPVPDEAADPFFSAGLVASLVGMHEQVPPAFSALKRGGVTAHEAARKGQPIELEARTIEVKAARLTGVEAGPGVSWDIEVSVSKGTYVRALARDLGRAIDSAAHLGALKRTRSGMLDLTQAHALEDVEATAAQQRVQSLFADPVAALGLPAVRVGADGALRVSVGQSLDVAAHDAQAVAQGADVAVVTDDVVLAIYVRAGDVLKPQAVIPGGVRGGE